MKVLITGLTGFTGSHLAEYLLEKDCTIIGTVFNKKKLYNIEHITEHIHIFGCDLCVPSKVKRIIQKVDPDYIFHLAAETRERRAKKDSKEMFNINVTGTMNLLEALLESGINARIFIPGSSAQFGLVRENENPVKETNTYRPVTKYAVSKIAQAMIAYQYYLAHNLKIIRTHTFNYTGPRQSHEFVCSAFAKQIAEIEKGLAPPVIQVGNLYTRRDIMDVRDVVKAYWIGIQKGIPGEVYNICSGKSYLIKAILEKLMSLTDVSIEVKQVQNKVQSSDVPFQVGNFNKFKKLTGWEPEIPIERILNDLLDYWRSVV